MNNNLRAIAISLMLFSTTTLSGVALADTIKVHLSGWQEVLPVQTLAVGTGSVVVGTDHSLSGKVTVKGVQATAAHIHLARSRENGPVAVTLENKGKNVWAVPDATKLTDAQYAAFLSNELYINVHSEAHPGGEIRAQIMH